MKIHVCFHTYPDSNGYGDIFIGRRRRFIKIDCGDGNVELTIAAVVEVVV